jgi:hypothetical protein
MNAEGWLAWLEEQEDSLVEESEDNTERDLLAAALAEVDAAAERRLSDGEASLRAENEALKGEVAG